MSNITFDEAKKIIDSEADCLTLDVREEDKYGKEQVGQTV